MKRRALVTMIAAAPVPAAQAQSPLPVIGYLGNASPDVFASRLHAFREGLAETGYVEGRNVAIEYRWAEGDYTRFPAFLADLIGRRVNVIAAPGSTPAAMAAKAATSTIPVVFAIGNDPVASGLVASLCRPGGNLTGVAVISVELGPKQLQLLLEVVPAATSIALLVNPTSPVLAAKQASDLQATAGTLGLKLHVLHASAPDDLEAVFATMRQLGASGLVIGNEAMFTAQSDRLAALALRHSIPAIYQFREFAAAGGLMSYGASLTHGHRLAGIYTGRILRGEKPAELPVEQTTRFVFAINLATAKALGLAVPPSIVARADEVIE
jgi:putative ABC transport system substrate-binding protein